ncbi:hypothetical protein ACFE04_013081 [Oxalis oulophora]
MKPSINQNFNHQTLNLLKKSKTLNSLTQIHSQIITTGLSNHTYPLSKLLSSASILSLPYTLSIFNQIPNPTIFLYNTLISSITSNHNKHTHIAFSLYTKILSNKTLQPNTFTYPSLFKACSYGSCSWLRLRGKALHCHVLKFIDYYDQVVQAAIFNFYASSGDLIVARYLFDQISFPDLASWNSILSAYARNSSSQDGDSLSIEALCLFNEMQSGRLVKPNEVTLVALISVCAKLGAFSQGIWAHAYVMKSSRLLVNRFVGTALVDMYAKCGYVGLAYQLFDKMLVRDTLCYNAMIGGFALHGRGHEALHLFGRMKLELLAPDDVTFIVAMYACSHVGLVNEGCEIFESIKRVYGIEPKQEHYGCLVDILGRAGMLNEAQERIKEMPMKPNAILWRSLLGAARVHGQLEIGELALNHLIELEPETSGNYVLLSNIYASVYKWDDVNRVRKLMKEHDINKMPGSSLVEVNGAMHEFITGDKTHPQTKGIFLKLEEISRRLKEHGHKPRTKEVLFDIEEEDKEDALSYHSERLAIAFALMVTGNERSPVRIIKNLRVCGDCHESTKHISKIYNREIIVRDRNRFHHFKDGACSCLDYW